MGGLAFFSFLGETVQTRLWERELMTKLLVHAHPFPSFYLTTKGWAKAAGFSFSDDPTRFFPFSGSIDYFACCLVFEKKQL